MFKSNITWAERQRPAIEAFFEQDFSWDPDWCTRCAEVDALDRGVQRGCGYSYSAGHPYHNQCNTPD